MIERKATQHGKPGTLFTLKPDDSLDVATQMLAEGMTYKVERRGRRIWVVEAEEEGWPWGKHAT